MTKKRTCNETSSSFSFKEHISETRCFEDRLFWTKGVQRLRCLKLCLSYRNLPESTARTFLRRTIVEREREKERQPESGKEQGGELRMPSPNLSERKTELLFHFWIYRCIGPWSDLSRYIRMGLLRTHSKFTIFICPALSVFAKHNRFRPF